MLDETTEKDLDPGIRNAVKFINDLGFETTDSGDGTKTDMECAVDFPMISVVTKPSELVGTAHKLCMAFGKAGYPVGSMGVDDVISFQASYDPYDGTAVVLVVGSPLTQVQ